MYKILKNLRPPPRICSQIPKFIMIFKFQKIKCYLAPKSTLSTGTNKYVGKAGLYFLLYTRCSKSMDSL